jgi:hypothetical protein
MSIPLIVAYKRRKEDINRELAGLLKLEWHSTIVDGESDLTSCVCGYGPAGFWRVQEHCEDCNPDFTADPVSLLRLMMKRADWEKFLQLTGWMYFDKDTDAPIYYIKTDFITDTTGRLAQAALEWLTAHRTEGGER